MVAACTGATAAHDDPSGRYRLLRVNDVVLPADMGPLPQLHGDTLPCRKIMKEGELEVDLSRGSYLLTYGLYESCRGSLMSRGGSAGGAILRGKVLSLTADFGAGRTMTFAAAVVSDTVKVADEFYSYVFVR